MKKIVCVLYLSVEMQSFPNEMNHKIIKLIWVHRLCQIRWLPQMLFKSCAIASVQIKKLYFYSGWWRNVAVQIRTEGRTWYTGTKNSLYFKAINAFGWKTTISYHPKHCGRLQCKYLVPANSASFNIKRHRVQQKMKS